MGIVASGAGTGVVGSVGDGVADIVGSGVGTGEVGGSGVDRDGEGLGDCAGVGCGDCGDGIGVGNLGIGVGSGDGTGVKLGNGVGDTGIGVGTKAQRLCKHVQIDGASAQFWSKNNTVRWTNATLWHFCSPNNWCPPIFATRCPIKSQNCKSILNITHQVPVFNEFSIGSGGSVPVN